MATQRSPEASDSEAAPTKVPQPLPTQTFEGVPTKEIQTRPAPDQGIHTSFPGKEIQIQQAPDKGIHTPLPGKEIQTQQVPDETPFPSKEIQTQQSLDEGIQTPFPGKEIQTQQAIFKETQQDTQESQANQGVQQAGQMPPVQQLQIGGQQVQIPQEALTWLLALTSSGGTGTTGSLEQALRRPGTVDFEQLGRGIRNANLPSEPAPSQPASAPTTPAQSQAPSSTGPAPAPPAPGQEALRHAEPAIDEKTNQQQPGNLPAAVAAPKAEEKEGNDVEAIYIGSIIKGFCLLGVLGQL